MDHMCGVIGAELNKFGGGGECGLAGAWAKTATYSYSGFAAMCGSIDVYGIRIMIDTCDI